MRWVEKHRAGEITEQTDQAERLREAEAKVARLERKIGQLVMEVDLLKKRGVNTAARRDTVDRLRSAGWGVEEACSAMRLARSTYHKRPSAEHRELKTWRCATRSKPSSPTGRPMAIGG